MDEAKRYQMLYCDNYVCRVNTFERGDGSDHLASREPGLCPGCDHLGKELFR